MNVIDAVTTAEEMSTMLNYTIDTENNITAHDSRKAARETGLPVFGTEEQFADVIGNDNRRLVEIWNSLPGVTPVTKFQSRKVATERIWRAIAHLGSPTSTEAESESTGPETPTESTPIADASPDSATSEVPATENPSPTKDAPKGRRSTKKAGSKKDAKTAKATRKPVRASNKDEARAGSKKAIILELLRRKGGATLAEIMKATDWQAHSVRGFIAGTLGKKMGLEVESFKNTTDQRAYRLRK